MAKNPLLQRRADTGTWDLVKGSDGNPVADYSEQHAVLTQLLEGRGSPGVPGWVWDSTAGSGTPGTHGSLLYLITEDTPAQRSLFKAHVADALQPLVNEGRILNVTADVVESQRVPGRIDGVVSWDVPQLGPQPPIFFPLTAI